MTCHDSNKPQSKVLLFWVLPCATFSFDGKASKHVMIVMSFSRIPQQRIRKPVIFERHLYILYQLDPFSPSRLAKVFLLFFSGGTFPGIQRYVVGPHPQGAGLLLEPQNPQTGCEPLHVVAPFKELQRTGQIWILTTT